MTQTDPTSFNIVESMQRYCTLFHEVAKRFLETFELNTIQHVSLGWITRESGRHQV